jgi:hypothetical protein
VTGRMKRSRARRFYSESAPDRIFSYHLRLWFSPVKYSSPPN